MSEFQMNVESTENEVIVSARAEWQSPQWQKLDAKEAEAAFTTPSADASFAHS